MVTNPELITVLLLTDQLPGLFHLQDDLSLPSFDRLKDHKGKGLVELQRMEIFLPENTGRVPADQTRVKDDGMKTAGGGSIAPCSMEDFSVHKVGLSARQAELAGSDHTDDAAG